MVNFRVAFRSEVSVVKIMEVPVSAERYTERYPGEKICEDVIPFFIIRDRIMCPVVPQKREAVLAVADNKGSRKG